MGAVIGGNLIHLQVGIQQLFGRFAHRIMNGRSAAGCKPSQPAGFDDAVVADDEISAISSVFGLIAAINLWRGRSVPHAIQPDTHLHAIAGDAGD